MITRSEVNDVLSGWLSKGTVLRVDFATADTSLSVNGRLAPAAEGIVCVRLGDTGFIEIHLAESWQFDFFAPDAMRVEEESRVGRDYTGLPQMTGAGLIVTSPQEVKLIFLEVVA